ncbi:hypothetical protein [Antrihabitans sp. YC2-6]|uniref:hypothetical protein n=1 Tax=Antrihabitans sp. YC2-6 TaxID=2799498 RepID=UPI0018F5221C|nr:hypothetical protein [Antrihabitans sp. YC2-6]MBJ8344502.1 hypothetical protein [Antrihabitans sp. YC2-6]
MNQVGGGKRRYSREFRDQCVRQVVAGLASYRSREDAVVAIAAAAIPVTTLRNWVRAELGAARTDRIPADTELQLRELRRQLHEAQQVVTALSMYPSVQHRVSVQS